MNTKHFAPSSAPGTAAEYSGPLTAARTPAIAFLELLPKWLICVPLVLQWIWLGLRHGSFMLPSLANPGITSGGLVGEGKREYFLGMGAIANSSTASWGALKIEPASALLDAQACMARVGLSFPIIAKPDIGWCGFGVRRIDDSTALSQYLDAFPAGETLLLQTYVSHAAEAGVFYVRHPDSASGQIIGLALRHFPQVCGDGRRSIAQLIADQPRLRRLQRNGQHRLELRLDDVPLNGQRVRLATIGSTRVGALYEDGTTLVTAALTQRIDAIAQDIPEFYFGRFDLRFDSIDALRRGEDFTIIEVNGAGSEAIEAWDPSLSPWQAFRLILRKQSRLFQIAAVNRRRSRLRPISPWQLARLHLRQQKLISRYPPSN